MPIIPLDILHDLVKVERSVAAFVIYTYICSVADGDGFAGTLQSIGEGTGFSKSTVHKALRILNRRNLIRTEKSSPTSALVHHVVRP